MQRRHLLCCGAAAAGALFTGLMAGGRALAAAGESLPITDLRCTRFLITLPDAVQMVLDTFEMMQGGEPPLHVDAGAHGRRRAEQDADPAGVEGSEQAPLGLAGLVG